jgi:membrane protein
VWVYYSAQIFLLGAEFTWVYATEVGSMKGAAAGNADGSGDKTSSAAVPAQRAEAVPAEPAPRRPPSSLDAKAAALILASLAVGSVFRRFVLPRTGKERF